MRRRHPVIPPIPDVWLMTDERLGDALWDAVARLPRGAGIVFRHYATPLPERRALFARLLRIARARGLVLVRSGGSPMRGEMGAHNARGRGFATRSAHSRVEAIAALRAAADAVFVSPVFATRSHAGAKALGPHRAATIARGLPLAVIALGGMDARGYARIRSLGFYGWAAIDAWMADQNRKAVPT